MSAHGLKEVCVSYQSYVRHLSKALSTIIPFLNTVHTYYAHPFHGNCITFENMWTTDNNGAFKKHSHHVLCANDGYEGAQVKRLRKWQCERKAFDANKNP